MSRVGVPRALWWPFDSPSSEAWEMYRDWEAERGEALVDGPSEWRSGEGELLSPLAGDGRPLRAM